MTRVSVGERNHSLRSRILALASGAGIGQFAVFLSAPAISRIYGPDAVGYYSAWFAIVALGVTVASLRWEYALPSAAEHERTNVLALALLSTLATSGVLFVVTLFTADRMAGLLVWLAPVVLLQATYQCSVQWALSQGSIGAAGYAKASHGVGQAGAQTVLGLVSPAPVSLVIGYLASALIGLLPALKRSRRRTRPQASRLAHVANRYWRTSLWVLISSVFNTLGTQAPIFILSVVSVASAGQFALGMRSATAPIMLMGIAIAQVFMAQISTGETDQIGQKLSLVVNRLFPVLLSCLGALSAMGASLTDVLLGPEWREAGMMLQILSPALLLIAISSTVSMIPISLGHARGEAVYQLLLVATRLGLMGIGLAYWDTMGVVVGYAIATIVCLSGYIIWCFRLVEAPVRAAFKYSGKEVWAIGAILAACLLSYLLFTLFEVRPWWSLACALACLTPLVLMRWRP